jgi:antitoxin Phd
MSTKRKNLSATSRPLWKNPGEPDRFTATQAKNEFGLVLESVFQGGRAVITKHGTPKAIVISMDEFDRMSHAAESALNTLGEEFDALFATMQTSKSRRGMKAVFAASPEELGKAAVLGARKRG